ncbi:MAG: hypothetical protein KAI17_23105, partial [Thiotrichaceae bacterium]|nr:hypothetical protein [Thiotrichaceae bacterium]
MTGSGTFTPGTGTVTFDGTGAQNITSLAGTTQPFYSLQNSNTGNTVTVVDKLEISAGGTLTIDASATLALAGNEFNDNTGTVTNNGILTMDGDNTFTSTALTIGGTGTTKFTDASGATLSTGIAGLADVEFNSSGNTFSLSEDMNYISGDITITNGTLSMLGFDITLADAKTLTNSGTWSAPTGTSSQFTCAGAAIFVGNDMNFYDFYAVPGAAKTIIFADARTYTVANLLTLTGTSGNELTLTNTGGTTAILDNTGDNHSVDYVKVDDVNATAGHKITATNSLSIGGVTTNWIFTIVHFISSATGSWNDVNHWDQNRVPDSADDVEINHDMTLDINSNIRNLTVNSAKTLTFGAGKTLSASGSVTVISGGTITINDGTLTAGGNSDINGTVTLST